MGIQQGFCSVAPLYLIAAWKADPQHPVAGDHFAPGIEDQISWASFYYPAPTYWSPNGTMPANTSIGPALICDQNLTNPGPGPSIYAVWKGEEFDTRLFFARLTLPFNLVNQPSDPESQSWQPQQQIPGAISGASPSIAFVGEVGEGLSPFLFTVWSGNANGQSLATGDNTLWYSITPIPSNPGYVDNLAAAVFQVPGAASSNGAAVTVDLDGNLWLVWYDTAAKQWSYLIGTVNGVSIAWSAEGRGVINASHPPNGAGFSLGSAYLGNQGDPYGVYAAWSDASSNLWISGIENLINGSNPPTPFPSAGAQATGNGGCALASLDEDLNGNLSTVLWAMWADTAGQLHYASSTDAVNWQDYGNLSNATTAPDYGFFRIPPIHWPFPIKF